MKDNYIVEKVWIKNRIDCCSNRINGVKVFVNLFRNRMDIAHAASIVCYPKEIPQVVVPFNTSLSQGFCWRPTLWNNNLQPHQIRIHSRVW